MAANDDNTNLTHWDAFITPAPGTYFTPNANGPHVDVAQAHDGTRSYETTRVIGNNKMPLHNGKLASTCQGLWTSNTPAH